MRNPTPTHRSLMKLAAWPAVAEDRNGCAHLVLMHPALVSPRRTYTLWGWLAALTARGGASRG